jgi:hypothetical protein
MQHDVKFMMSIKYGSGCVYTLQGTILYRISFYGLVSDSDWSMCRDLIDFIFLNDFFHV